MKIGDLVLMKSEPTSMGIVIELYQDTYDRGLQGKEVWRMAVVEWFGFGRHAFEISRLEVIEKRTNFDLYKTPKQDTLLT